MFLTALSLMLANFLDGEETKIRQVLYTRCVFVGSERLRVLDLGRDKNLDGERCYKSAAIRKIGGARSWGTPSARDRDILSRNNHPCKSGIRNQQSVNKGYKIG